MYSGSEGEGAGFTSAGSGSLKCRRETASPSVSKILGWIGFGAWITHFCPPVVDAILRFFSRDFSILSVCQYKNKNKNRSKRFSGTC